MQPEGQQGNHGKQGTTKPGRYRPQRKVDDLEYKLRRSLQDFKRGKFDPKSRDYVPGTGHPWVRLERYRFGTLDGWLIIDNFENGNEPFERPTQHEAITMLNAGQAMFATTGSLKKEQFLPAFIDPLAGYIDGAQSIEKLLAIMDARFSLSLVLHWSKSDGYGDDFMNYDILPAYRVTEALLDAAKRRRRLVVYRLGTEAEIRKIARENATLTPGNPVYQGQFDVSDLEQVRQLVTDSCRIWIRDALDGEQLHWGTRVKSANQPKQQPSQQPAKQPAAQHAGNDMY